jgi:hypothetical protein
MKRFVQSLAVLLIVVVAVGTLFAAGNKKNFAQGNQVSTIVLTKANSQVDTLYFTPSAGTAYASFGLVTRDSTNIKHVVVYRVAGSGQVSGEYVNRLGSLSGTAASDTIYGSHFKTTTQGQFVRKIVLEPVTATYTIVVTYADTSNSVDSTGVEYSLHQLFAK